MINKIYSNKLTASSLGQAFSKLESHNFTVGTIIVSNYSFLIISGWGKAIWDVACVKELVEQGIAGYIFEAKVMVDKFLSDDIILLVPNEPYSAESYILEMNHNFCLPSIYCIVQ